MRLRFAGYVNVDLVVFYALLSNNNEANSETTWFPDLYSSRLLEEERPWKAG